MNNPATLLVPEKTDTEFDQVVATWLKRGGTIRQLGKYWIKEETLAQQKIAIYGNQTFALVLAQIYNVTLLSPDDTLIARLEARWVKRHIRAIQLKDIRRTDFPAFIKPVIPKLFIAGIFDKPEDFNAATHGLEDTEFILIAEIVHDIRAEARAFISNSVIMDIALYEGAANLPDGYQFLSDFIATYQTVLPSVVVVDIAFSAHAGWFILEFNACWGAGLNNCVADKVIDCIIGATINK
ncbi:ATP-grasp domain-containing protein [Chitinophaga pinensis]|uniref:DUF4343 domain-containing protein n=1 Tax=Chitinophaga pinensis TaxID=79329 RepID=A0A5C6LKZ3_9BACT|nr:ATP-grasp domain-containing protein [Chitinophaga pinensis]TWV93347.1 DUF4343 domain-containing protein [Chitinophaga pinensis]